MLSTLVSAGWTVMKRLVADWLIVGAAFVTIVLATILLSSGPIYADAVTISALQQSIDDAPVTGAHLRAEAKMFPEFYEQTDSLVRVTIDRSLISTGADVYTRIEADAYGLTDQPSDTVIELASFQYFEGVETRATVVDGVWPGGTGPPYEVALNAPAAETLGLEVGDVFETTNRRDPEIQTSARVVGIYTVDDPIDPYWFEDDLALSGSTESASFKTIGPFVVSLESMLEGFTPIRTNAEWRILPRHENLTVAEVDGLRASVTRLASELDDSVFASMDPEVSGSSQFTVTTGLPSLLTDVDRSLTVTRSSVLALLIQLAILAGYALVLTAGLLVDTRRTETNLARSRGTSPGQILTISILEGLALTVPAVLVGPYLATQLLTILNTAGPLAAIGLTIDPEPTLESYALATIAAAVSIVALAWPAYSSARRFGRPIPRHRRQLSRSGAQRIGLDLALLGLAAIVFWQLQVVGPDLAAPVRGRFGVDPLLVIAPALGLLTGGVLALRMVPLLARLAEWLASARRSTVAALASWQVARRPVRYARSSLLLMMAIGIGFFAASYSTTWIASQRDQATYAVGSDIRVLPNRNVGSSMTDVHLSAAHKSIDGVQQSMPVQRILGQLAGDGGVGQFIIFDAAKSAQVVDLRDDLAPGFADLMSQLVAGRPTVAGVDLPSDPSSLTLRFDAIEELPEFEEAPEGQPQPPEPTIGFTARVRAIIQDGDGLLHRLDAGTIAVNEGPSTMQVDLMVGLADGKTVSPVYPLKLINIEIQSNVPNDYSRVVQLTLDDLTVLTTNGESLQLTVQMDWMSWEPDVSRVIGADIGPRISIAPAAQPDVLQMDVETGVGFGVAPAYFSIRPIGTMLPSSFPIVVTEKFPAATFADVGDEVRLPPLRIANDTAVVVGTISTFPTADADLGEVVILDLPTYQMMGYQPGFGLDQVDTYWLKTSGDDQEVLASLRKPPLNSFGVESRRELTDTLASDPVALGTIGALTVGFVAASVFAAVGFAVSATVSARERLIEFALLRALGLSPRQLGSWLILEQAVLVVVSLGLGTLIGVILTAAILPLVTLTQDGGPAVPDVIINYPWGTVAGLELAVIAVLGLIVMVLTVLLRRVGLGSLLRLGEN